MFTNIAPHDALLWKYIQNTTVSEVVPKGTDFRTKISSFALTKVYLYIYIQFPFFNLPSRQTVFLELRSREVFASWNR